MSLKKLLVSILFLASISSRADAGAVEWFFSPVEFDVYNVYAVVYGDDNRGLAGYEIRLDGLAGSDIDPNSISWAPNFVSAQPPVLTVGPDSFSVVETPFVSPRVFDTARTSGVNLGALTIPGGFSTPFFDFGSTSAILFHTEAPDLPLSAELEELTLFDNQVSEAHHGGNLVVDYAYRVVPDGGGTVDFGIVDEPSATHEDIIALAFGGFVGPVDITGIELAGPDADSFSVPGFVPTVLDGEQQLTTYDVNFSPHRVGSFEAQLTFYLEFPIFPEAGTGAARFTLVGIAAAIHGDTNADRLVNADDLNNVRNNFGATGPDDGTLPGDAFPFDGMVNITDLNGVRNNFGASAAVPEPSTLALASLFAFVGVVVRRRRG